MCHYVTIHKVSIVFPIGCTQSECYKRDKLVLELGEQSYALNRDFFFRNICIQSMDSNFLPPPAAPAYTEAKKHTHIAWKTMPGEAKWRIQGYELITAETFAKTNEIKPKLDSSTPTADAGDEESGCLGWVKGSLPRNC